MLLTSASVDYVLKISFDLCTYFNFSFSLKHICTNECRESIKKFIKLCIRKRQTQEQKVDFLDMSTWNFVVATELFRVFISFNIWRHLNWFSNWLFTVINIKCYLAFKKSHYRCLNRLLMRKGFKKNFFLTQKTKWDLG